MSAGSGLRLRVLPLRVLPLPGGLRMRDPAALIATGFGAGRIHPAPGTWGTLAAMLPGVGLLLAGGTWAVLAGFVAALLGGVWAAARFEDASGSHDSGMIVMDEWAGLFAALLFAAPVWDQLVLAFFLFRAFDVFKPWPIRWLDRSVPGAWGVMLDDVAAGIAAGVCVYGYGIWIASF